MHKYDDIINMPHHISSNHKQMSLYQRAAQFAPFAALTGYDDEVKETARLTDKEIIIDEGLKALLDNKISIIQNNIKDKPLITFTYFVPDEKKNGGKYVDVTNNVKKINTVNQTIILVDNTVIDIKYIIGINGEILKDIW